ncbi:anti-sigma factor family protein [Amycolatopsis sp. H20-H5]|uniref:anti-sigma factor family protein n=1 Tax=Amycolatopsis sp. H20-H5 TaxID=3046309 RepID=UPI002DC020E3|nr:zf-HC2 domain-containing protein [Amycolatopsis sp. H20-H5]MEC3980979.1 zf-HC2 domain-containing protein [Amycolatopsis sp. H20-H5]
MTARPEDPFTNYDAAYVLGALSPDDRQQFEQHLPDCDRCAASVRELAGLPGLLAQTGGVPAPSAGPPPASLLPALLQRVHRRRQRRFALVGGALATAVAACAALVVVLVTGPDTAPGTTVAAGTSMTALGSYPVRADASLGEQVWGTRVEMSCSYGGNRTGDYVLVTVGPDGRVTELASWQAVPQDTARIVVSTPLHRGDIRALEIRTRTGMPVLRLTT